MNETKLTSKNPSGLLNKALNVENSSDSKESEGLLAKISKLNISKSGTQMQSTSTAGAQNAIIVQNGIFTIKSNLETSSVIQDPVFKELVESVLLKK